MKISTVLFDLDGTLLPMDQDEFVKAYFGTIAKKLAPHGYEPEKLIKTIWNGTNTMVKNDGSKTNEEAFWSTFSQMYPEKGKKDEPIFDEYYHQEFDTVQRSCGVSERAKEVIEAVKSKKLRIALATNPIFPSIATEKRIEWAGLTPDEFELITTYENSSYCKPNLEYYKSILNYLGVQAEECLMVGNDVTEDMVAEKLGMKVFLLTDCLINKNEEDIERYPHGTMEDLIDYIHHLN